MEKISLKQEEKIELRANLTKLIAAKPVRISESTRPIGQPGTSSWYHLFTHMNNRTQIASFAALVLVIGSTIIIYNQSSKTTLPSAIQLAAAPRQEKTFGTSVQNTDPQTMAAKLLAQADEIVQSVKNSLSSSVDSRALVSIGTAEALLTEAHESYDAGDYETALILAEEAINYAQNTDNTSTAPISTTVAAETPSTVTQTVSPANSTPASPNSPTTNTTSPVNTPASGRVSTTLVTQPTSVNPNLTTIELRNAAQNAIAEANIAYDVAKRVVETNTATHAAAYSLLIRAGNTISLAQADVRASNYLQAINHALVAKNLAATAKATAERVLNSVRPTTLNTPTATSGQPALPSTATSTSTSSTIPVINIPNPGPGIPINTGTVNPTNTTNTGTSTFTTISSPSPTKIIPRLQLP
jgi:hypothetical protein